MRGRIGTTWVVVVGGLSALTLATSCTDLGVEVPSASPSGSSSAVVSPSEVTPSPSQGGSESPLESASPSASFSVPSEPPIPVVEGFDLSDPGWRKAAPPVVMEGLGKRGASLKSPDGLVGGYVLKGHGKDISGDLKVQYQREGDRGWVNIRLRESSTFPPDGWDAVVQTMSGARQIGVSICYQWVGTQLPGCFAFTEDLRFDADYQGDLDEMPMEKLEVVLEDFIAHFAKP